MSLPFTHEQFLDVFGAYHRALWPFAALLWLLTLAAVVHVFRRGAGAGRIVAFVLAVHWAWSAAAYHLAFFRSINPAATIFAGLFAVQAVLLLWRGLARPHVTILPGRTLWRVAGSVLVVYALLYPVLGLLFGLRYPRLPTFGVPCPTTILTAGMLLLVPRRQARPLAPVPVIWSAIGGSAAFLLDIRADYALVVAGVVLAAYTLTPASDPGGSDRRSRDPRLEPAPRASQPAGE